MSNSNFRADRKNTLKCLKVIGGPQIYEDLVVLFCFSLIYPIIISFLWTFKKMFLVRSQKWYRFFMFWSFIVDFKVIKKMNAGHNRQAIGPPVLHA